MQALQRVRIGAVLVAQPSQAAQVQAVLLQVAGHILPRHAIHVHHRQDALGHSILEALHVRAAKRREARVAWKGEPGCKARGQGLPAPAARHETR